MTCAWCHGSGWHLEKCLSCEDSFHVYAVGVNASQPVAYSCMSEHRRDQHPVTTA